jgi:hypothetical protein
MSISTWHKIAGLAHLSQAAVIGYLVSTSDSIRRWPLTQHVWKGSKDLTEYNLAALLPVFPALSTLNHAKEVFAPTEGKVNYVRWYEYSLSAGVMLWLIASLSGISDIDTLAQICAANVALQMVGLACEQAVERGASEQQINALLAVGWFIHMSIWIPIIMSFQTIIDEAEEVPEFVRYIVWTLFTLFTSFGVWQYLYVKKYIKTWEYYERGFIVLSLVSKSLLIWMSYGGVFNASIE